MKPTRATADCWYCRVKSARLHIVAPSKQGWCRLYYLIADAIADAWGLS